MNINELLKSFEKLQEKNPMNDLQKKMIIVSHMPDGSPIYGFPPKRKLEEKKHKYIIKHNDVLHYANSIEEIMQKLEVNINIINKIKRNRMNNKYEILRWNNKDY